MAVNKGKKIIEKLKQSSTTLLLTEGKGDDIEEDDGEDVEKSEEEELVKNKDKVIIKRLKLGEEVEDVIFKKPPPTF